MSAKVCHKKTFGVSAAVTHNAVIATLDGTADQNIAYADRLARDPSVVSATSTDDLERSFSFDLMSAVVALIIALAGGLALVVLFTLANTNVSERVREMATLKVLGFYDREVHRYVNKEMLILAGMGIVVGLPLGRAVGGLLTAAAQHARVVFRGERALVQLCDRRRGDDGVRAARAAAHQSGARPHRSGQLAQVRGVS